MPTADGAFLGAMVAPAVLIALFDRGIRELLAQYLTKNGFQASTAGLGLANREGGGLEARPVLPAAA